MTIRSVDMQVLVQKTLDIARVQQAQQVEGQHRQMEFAQNITAQNEKIARSVNDPLRNEAKLVHEKEEQEKNSKKQKNEKEEEEEKSNDKKSASPRESGRGNRLDITI